MASAFISSPSEIVLIDSRTRSGTVTLPLTNSIPYRVVSFKDQYGSFSNSTMTLSTQVGESFDDGTTTKTFSNAFTSMQLYATSSKWMVLNATQSIQQTISSLIVNQLIFGTGAGWVQFGPLQASVVSSIQLNTNDAYLNNVYVGNQSTLNDVMYYGLFGNYNNTVLAEISTGAGTQEFLTFKGSSTSDRIRFQTTGAFVVETGVSARLWDGTTRTTVSNATPAFVINTSSNVGIQTATPGATLDVAGTSRAVTLSSQQLFVSSVNGGLPLSATNIVSTVGGLGQIYLSTLSPFLTTSAILTSSLLASTITTSSLQVNSLTVGTGTGWLNLGPLQTVAISSIQLNTNDGYINNLYVGIQSTLNDLMYYGLFGNYNNTVLAEISTGAGTQEFLTFKGSSTSDRIRFQTTGAFVVETGVSARLWDGTTRTTLSNATPAFVITTSSNVGIQTATPATTLDVAGTGRFQNVSTLNLTISSINGQSFGGPINSTTIGLGSIGYISSSQLLSTTAGLLASGLTLPSLVSSVEGLGSAGYISTLSLLSTVAGIGSGFTGSTTTLSAGTVTAAVLSTLNLNVSSINGQSFGGPINSTTIGLGSIGYISSSQLLSTTAGLLASGSGVTLPSLVSSVAGLGSIGYISTSQLVSTVAGLALQPAGSQSNISAFFVSAGFITASSVTTTFLLTSSVFFSSLSTSIINFGGGFGYLTMPDIYPNTVYTSTVTSSNVLVGWNSQLSPIQFFGFGSYSNTVISEVSTGGATQELVMFRGSNSSDRIRMQTTGSIVFEPGVSARLWPTVPSNVTPAMLINTSSNIGIQTASPTVPLDVAGAIRSVSFSTQQITTSSILGAPVFATGATFASSVTFRGPSTFFLGAISTSFLTAGPSQVYFPGPVGIGVTNPAFLLDVAGTGEFSTILTSSLTSWLTISTTQLGTSSVVANTSRTIIASSFQMGASTFTGKWNDAQYYVLQTI
jgi:hypothetical protein